jgi:hypothetical protein
MMVEAAERDQDIVLPLAAADHMRDLLDPSAAQMPLDRRMRDSLLLD